jgi:muconate cycloisomerase
VPIAEANSLELLGSGLTEAGIGFIASVHLFSTLDLVLPAELNAPAFLETMAVSGIQIYDHVVTVPEGPGLGVTPDEDYIKANLLDVESS